MMYGVGPFLWSSHYVSPLAAAFVLIGMACLRAVYLWLWAAFRRRAAAPGSVRALAPAICVSSLLAILVLIPAGLRLQGSSYAWTLPSYSGRGWCCEANRNQRHTVESRLLQPGNHLVMVRYREAVGTERVYNSASIDKSRIVWAHDLSPQENSELLRYFEGRSVWTAEVGKTGVTLKQGYAGL
jgi:hypothetical protein